jgi:formylmethanofuran dehydrogenase subunit E
LASPFVQKRKAGVPPQNIEPEITGPLVERILALEEEAFLDIGPIQQVEVDKGKGSFTAKRCASCGELTFVNRLRVTEEGKLVCIPCSGYTA